MIASQQILSGISLILVLVLGLSLLVVGAIALIYGLIVFRPSIIWIRRAYRYQNAHRSRLSPKLVGQMVWFEGKIAMGKGFRELVSPLSGIRYAYYEIKFYLDDELDVDSVITETLRPNAPVALGIANEHGEIILVEEFENTQGFHGEVSEDAKTQFKTYAQSQGIKIASNPNTTFWEYGLPIGMGAYAVGILTNTDEHYRLRPPQDDPGAPIASLNAYDFSFKRAFDLSFSSILSIIGGIAALIVGWQCMTALGFV